MKSKLFISALIIAAIACNLISCSKDGSNTTTPAATTVTLSLPSTPYQYNSPMGASDEVVTLGRVLFYDTHLSINNSIACGSCHRQSIGFSDNVPTSSGFQNQKGTRNAPPIQNLSNGGFGPAELFWDGREKSLVDMVLKPMLNHAEMGVTDLNSIVNNVKSLPYYSNLFMNAFRSTDININNIATALSSFVGTITSQNTRFDLFNNGIGSLSALEQQGQSLFFNKYNCNSCHQTQVANGYQRGGGTTPGFINIGLDLNYADNGLGALNGNTADNGKFKIPNLRNVALTAPYMHDGRFATLDDVLEHYSHNIMNHPNLDPRLKDGTQAKQMNITTDEKTAIIAFLNTLTDYTMITDLKFSNPFISK